ASVPGAARRGVGAMRRQNFRKLIMVLAFARRAALDGATRGVACRCGFGHCRLCGAQGGLAQCANVMPIYRLSAFLLKM
ncbi:hypothetical protein A2U01_0037169, partial [Trifolium medium]|nr:hypothetical protein [Trifolium medium]